MMLPWGRFFSPQDSQGRESRTLFFISASWVFMSVRYLLGGLALPWGGVPVTDMPSYGLAVAALLGIWLGREWISQSKPNA